MPISNTIIYQKVEKKEFEAIPANIYQVQITDIKEKLKTPWGMPKDGEATELYITFEFALLEGEHKGRKLWKDIRPVTPVPSEGQF